MSLHEICTQNSAVNVEGSIAQTDGHGPYETCVYSEFVLLLFSFKAILDLKQKEKYWGSRFLGDTGQDETRRDKSKQSETRQDETTS